jgi:hypothetical protein
MPGFGLVAAAAALASAGAAETPPPREPTVMIVEFPRGAPFLGFPARCPGSPPDADPAEEICLAELYQGRIRVVRHISGPRVAMGTRLRLTAHARNWPHGMRMMVATVPFNDNGTRGQFAFWWETPEENGDYCHGEAHLAEWDDGPVRRAFLRGYRRHFRPWMYAEATDTRCIPGGR